MPATNLIKLEAFHDDEELNVVIETPKGSRNKYNYDEKLGLFKLGGVLPSGASFPFDFGFVPSTFSHSSVWALTGAHRSLACRRCHPRGAFTRTIGSAGSCRSWGWARCSSGICGLQGRMRSARH